VHGAPGVTTVDSGGEHQSRPHTEPTTSSAIPAGPRHTRVLQHHPHHAAVKLTRHSPGLKILIHTFTGTSCVVEPEMDMGPFFFTQPNPTITHVREMQTPVL